MKLGRALHCKNVDTPAPVWAQKGPQGSCTHEGQAFYLTESGAKVTATGGCGRVWEGVGGRGRAQGARGGAGGRGRVREGVGGWTELVLGHGSYP